LKSEFARRDFERLLSLGTSFQAGRVLFESVRMGLFDELGGRAVSAKALAGKLKLSESALSRFLRVLQAMGLLERNKNSYKNTAVSRKYLCRGEETYIGDFFIHQETLQVPWQQIEFSLRTLRMVKPDKGRTAAYSQQLKKFLLAMDALGRIKSQYIKRRLAVKRFRHMLDLGGGMGTYSMNFACANRNLRATVFDLKDVVQHARRAIKKAGMQDRIKVQAGQCLRDSLPEGPFDLALISNLLHIYDSKDCGRIIKKAAGKLAAGGTLLVHDYIFGCKDALSVALFDMTMLLGTPRGRCPEKKEIECWMKSAGIRSIRSADVPGGSAIVWGRKKM